MLVHIKTFFSVFNTILPSILAVVNILFISKMCNTIIAQNLVIIDSIAASKEQTVAKIIEIPTDTVVIPSEPSILSVISPYIVVIGSVVLFGVFIYVYYTSSGKGPSPDFPSIGIKRMEEIITKKVDEKSAEIVESIGQKSTEVISVITEKTSNNASESFINGGFNYILASISQQMKGNNSEISKVISKVTDDSNSATIDLIDSLTTDLGKKMDSNHAELSSMYSSLSAQIDELKQLIINSISS